MIDEEISRNPRVSDALLRALADNGTLNATAFTRARTIAGIAPSGAAWTSFLERVFVIGGAAIASAALVCFIAYNWDALGRWIRFALFEGAVLFSAIAAMLLVSKPLLSKAFAVLAYFSLGGLLAFVGQTYQTGADTYQLFFAWATLGLIWCFAAKWWGLWLVAFGVLQIGLATWINLDVVLPMMKYADWRAYAVIGANLGCFAVFYSLRNISGLDSSWLWRIAAATTIAWATLIAISWGESDKVSLPLNAIAALLVVALYCWTSRVGHESFDPTLLYVCAFAAIALSTWWLGKSIARLSSMSPEVFSVFAIYLAATAAGATLWITKLTKRHRVAQGTQAVGNPS
jgi:uncharacterized membrane protein